MNKRAPNHDATSLYRFCLRHGLSLSPDERSAEGIALSKVARERELPLVTGRERIEDRWIKNRLYPISFLEEWLRCYTEAKAASEAAEPGLRYPPGLRPMRVPNTFVPRMSQGE